MKVRLEIPAKETEGQGVYTWERRALLVSIYRRSDYRGGLNDEGVSLFDAEAAGHQGRRYIVEAARLVAAESPQEPYAESPNRKAAPCLTGASWDTHMERATGMGTKHQPKTP